MIFSCGSEFEKRLITLEHQLRAGYSDTGDIAARTAYVGDQVCPLEDGIGKHDWDIGIRSGGLDNGCRRTGKSEYQVRFIGDELLIMRRSSAGFICDFIASYTMFFALNKTKFDHPGFKGLDSSLHGI